ncbi:MAG: ATP phosphoribosyltransferase regulatory subunit [Pseudohongiellaceae bacterium]
MTRADRWLLPDGVEEVLPREAHRLETLRRRILDLYGSWGYELVITPLIEFLDSLLVGSSHDLDLQTFKITDQLSGRMMGVRADITPQVARIDAHNLKREGPVRLCYADNVLHTRPRGLQASRIPLRVGAELFGHQGSGCDVELICLMMAMLKEAEVPDVHLVLGHVGIFRSLVQAAGLDEAQESDLFDALQRKATDEIEALLSGSVDDRSLRAMLSHLPELNGDEGVLDRAREVFAGAPPAVQRELDELASIAEAVHQRLPQVSLGYDLSELRGYRYHTGVVFASYCPAYGRAIAKGGRFDAIGRDYGRARPASGFDADLKVLARLSRRQDTPTPAILAPSDEDPGLWQRIEELRASGERVITALSDEDGDPGRLAELGCDRKLVWQGNGWQPVSL